MVLINCKNISHYNCFLLHFWSNKCWLGEHKTICWKSLKICTDLKLSIGSVHRITELKWVTNAVSCICVFTCDCWLCIPVVLSLSLRTVKMTLIGLTLTMNHLTGGILSIAVSLSPTSIVSFILKVNIATPLSTPVSVLYLFDFRAC